MIPNTFGYSVYVNDRCYLVTSSIRSATNMARHYADCRIRIDRTHYIYPTGTPRYGVKTVYQHAASVRDPFTWL